MEIAFLFIAGLILGSFINALVWRIREKRTWVNDRSECTHCHHKLGVLDLVPVLSWIFLQGRCRYCKKLISAQYPLVELCTGVLFVLSYLFWDYGLDSWWLVRFIIWLLAVVIMIALFVYDLRWMVFPNVLLYGFIITGILSSLVVVIASPAPSEAFGAALVAGLIGGGLFHAIYVFSRGKAIGDGDAYLGLGFGLLLADPVLVWIAITVASFIGSILGVFLLMKGKSAKIKVPFGPFLITGVIVSMLFGQNIWTWFNQLYLV